MVIVNNIVEMVAKNVNVQAAVVIPRMTCPALIFAANRKDRVIGRIYELMVSTKDKNLEINEGVFSGKKCAAIDFMPLLNETITMVVHIGAPALNVVIRCEVMVMVYGTAPQPFKMIIE